MWRWRKQNIANVRKGFENASGSTDFFFDGPAHEVRTLHAHTRSHPEGGGDGGEYGDDDVDDFSPDVLVFHSFV